MFRSQSKKSLKLQRETVRVLDASHLRAAQGGDIVIVATNSPALCTIEIPGEISGGGAGPISNGPEGCPRLPTISIIVNPRPILHP